MRIVDEHGFTSVAFPVIGAGSGSFNQRKALELMLDEFNAISSPADVRIVEYRR
jgi:O-acetyl-ADP-ribose deacetylase (regulator of RNase III)